MRYVLLKEMVKGIEDTNSDTVTLNKDLFLKILRAALSTEFDEAYYLSTYPDVKSAIESKQSNANSLLDHYVSTGYFEDRLPKRILIDEEYYLSNNFDLKLANKKSSIDSLQNHFDNMGYKEGRMPYENFSFWINL